MHKTISQGVTCLVLAYLPFSSFALAADLGGKVPARTWELMVSSYANPAIWSGVYAGLSIGYGGGNSEREYDRAGSHGWSQPEP